MHKYVLSLVAVLALALPASVANAGKLWVTYSSTSSLSLAGVIPMGTVVGSYTIQYDATASGPYSATGAAAGGVAHGPAFVLGANAAGPLFFSVAGDTFTGFVNQNINSGGGSLTSGGALNLFVQGVAAGTIHCTGATCTGFGLPASIPVPISLPISAPFVAPTATLGGLLLPTLNFAQQSFGTFGGLSILGTTTLVEVSRHLTPEPTSASLLGLGLLGLGVAARSLRRR